jgi:hypothetical protein
MSPASIHIFRKADNWQDRNANYRVVLDGKRVGNLGAGRSIDREVGAGAHEIRIRSSWMGSNKISFFAQDGQVLNLVCSNGRGLPFYKWNDYLHLQGGRVSDDGKTIIPSSNDPRIATIANRDDPHSAQPMSPDEKRQIRRVMPIGIIGLIMVISAKFFTSSGGKEGGITTTGWILFGIGFLFLLTAFVAIFRLIRRGYRGD